MNLRHLRSLRISQTLPARRARSQEIDPQMAQSTQKRRVNLRIRM